MTRSRHLLTLALIVAMTLVLALTLQANPVRQAGEDPGVGVVAAEPGGTSEGGVATIQFDNDTPFRRDGTDGGTVGNRFAPTNTHSIATVSFAVAGNFATSVIMTVWDVNATNVNVLQRQLVTGVPQSPATTGRFMAPLTAPVVGHTGEFIAGLRNSDYDPCSGNTALVSTCDGVALTQGTSPAPPFDSRGARVNFTTAAFTPVITSVASTGQDLGDTNAIFRATGNNLPVELMTFSID